jgi:hypothetical protein
MCSFLLRGHQSLHAMRHSQQEHSWLSKSGRGSAQNPHIISTQSVEDCMAVASDIAHVLGQISIMQLHK